MTEQDQRSKQITPQDATDAVRSWRILGYTAALIVLGSFAFHAPWLGFVQALLIGAVLMALGEVRYYRGWLAHHRQMFGDILDPNRKADP